MLGRASLTDKPDHLRWYCDSIEQGREVTGVLAGVPVPVRTHWNGEATKPCLTDVTSGALVCPCRLRVWGGVTTVYAPFITREGEKIVVPASELVGKELMKFTPGKLLTLFRPKKRCAGLKISIPTEDSQHQAWVKRVRPTCLHVIDEYLMHLWQIPELNAHFGVPFYPSVGKIVIEKGKGSEG